MQTSSIKINNVDVTVNSYNTIIIGTGAAGLNCADHLHTFGQEDIAIITEKLGAGTSNNAGSDKQTYYKMSVFGKDADSPYEMAKSLFEGGGMHGDLALIESVTSAQEFFHLVQIGVPFPHNSLGGYVGYKTDHDPCQRGTSAGPWTSNQMYQCLLREVKKKGIKIHDKFEIVSFLTKGEGDDKRVIGAVAINTEELNSPSKGITVLKAENIVFAVGGPGGIYKTSVYPLSQSGAIGIALKAGAKAANLTESQYGLASTKFRWNLSGTYQQVIPRYFSTAQDGSDPQDFMNKYFESMGEMATAIFLKGYQWPFDSRKIANKGSSIVDILVYNESVVNGRRVFMDFLSNPKAVDGLDEYKMEDMSEEASTYLKNSNAFQELPIQRLQHMNQLSIDLYMEHDIDLTKEPLEIDVCAQHNNGGLAGDMWWESNVKHLFPVGEVNGSHGVYRPGGSALNSGQVGSLRAAQRIANKYKEEEISMHEFTGLAEAGIKAVMDEAENALAGNGNNSLDKYVDEFQTRMTNSGSHIRNLESVNPALEEAYTQIEKIADVKIDGDKTLADYFRASHLVLAHAAYLQSIKLFLENGGGSRGSYIVLDKAGENIRKDLAEFNYKLDDGALKEKVLETILNNGKFESKFVERRAMPDKDFWFENVWNDYLEGKIFD